MIATAPGRCSEIGWQGAPLAARLALGDTLGEDPMKPITLGLLALFALAASSGMAFADCTGHVVKAPDQTTVATTKGSTPVTVPTPRDDG